MNTHKGCVEVAPKDFMVILKKIKEDGIIIHNKKGFHARFTKTPARFKNDSLMVFSSPFIGYFKGDKAYMVLPKLHYYGKSMGGAK